MRLEIEVGGRTRDVTVTREGAGFAVTVDGRTRYVDVVRIGAHVLSLIVDNEQPHDAVIVAGREHGQLTVTVGGVDVPVGVNGRRRGRRDHAAAGGSGPQKVTAPMPGKVVRIMVKPGDAVEPRQPLVVVEAMKMENELRALRAGTVGDVQAREGQSVDAGALLVTIQ